MTLRKIGVVLLALLLAAMAMVPMVSGGEITGYSGKGDLVDKINLSAMTPPLLLKLSSQGFTEEQISQYLLKMEKPRQDGWTLTSRIY